MYIHFRGALEGAAFGTSLLPFVRLTGYIFICVLSSSISLLIIVVLDLWF